MLDLDRLVPQIQVFSIAPTLQPSAPPRFGTVLFKSHVLPLTLHLLFPLLAIEVNEINNLIKFPVSDLKSLRSLFLGTKKDLTTNSLAIRIGTDFFST